MDEFRKQVVALLGPRGAEAATLCAIEALEDQ